MGEFVQCSKCLLFKRPGEFHRNSAFVTGLSTRCMACTLDCSRNYRCTLRGKAVSMVCSARYRAKARERHCLLTYSDILDMLWEQGARCYYSGVPMEYLQPF